MNIQIMDVVRGTTVDGPGFRTSIYAAGCHHACPECHNPESWNPKAGYSTTVEELLDIVKEEEFSQVTFSGGDPLYQLEGFTELARRIKEETGKNIWCFTGFRWEELAPYSSSPFMEKVTAETIVKFLQYIDVIVDGPFLKALRDEDLLFRGSSNQRLIDVKKSLQAGEVVLWYRN